jgi:Family of unknown function (DUF5899)
MEIAIPFIALAGLYMVSKQTTDSDSKREGFDNAHTMSSSLPNADITDRNYPDQYSTVVPEVDVTSKLSTANAYTGNSAYTDKFFNPNVANAQVKNPSIQASVGGISAPLDPTPQTKSYYALTGDKVGSDYFQHNNMVPYFGSNMHSRKFSANGTESLMDNYSGAGSQIITKKEQSPLFAPGENYQWPLGMPNMTDFMQSRVNVSAKMSNVKPFQEESVAPGLGAGYGTDGLGGFNSGMHAREQWLPKTVDELRVDNNPKSSGNLLFGHEGPGNSYIKMNSSSDHQGVQEKHRPDGSFPMGRERLLTTTGLEKGPTMRAINVDRYVSRPETTTDYMGNAGHADGPATYVDGEYMPSKHMDLGSVPVVGTYAPNRQGVYAEDFGSKSQFAYPNNRSSNAQPSGGVQTNAEGYFGAVGSSIGAAIAPLLDVLRPSRKENSIGNLRPYQNAKPAVASSYVYNPSDAPAHTMRETTQNSLNHWNIDAGQRGGAYETTAHQPVVNERNTTTDYMYIGAGSAGERGREARPYDAEYNQRNNDVKAALVSSTGYTPAGKLDTLNATVNMTAKPKDVIMQNNRAVAPSMPSQTPSYYSGGSVAAKEGLYSNIQLDRNRPDVLTALNSNPYALSITKTNGGI